MFTYLSTEMLVGSGDSVNKMFLRFISDGERNSKLNSVSEVICALGKIKHNEGGVGSPGQDKWPQPFHTGFRENENSRFK